jgi:hypothetical protein
MVDVAPINQLTGLVLFLLLPAAVILAMVKPRTWTMVLAGVAALLWLFSGVVGSGINC